ncbi:hypothetical protein Glove_348g27 [Diversispora epigaea]|uniref:Uncharacterized protein n=1 Tax=Diversispora epigaea TaxID=1348612 RepID=A0A397HLT0_9GLOM|nr:hypothetical protein Glove_348g27 [Diversispora epigaea]
MLEIEVDSRYLPTTYHTVHISKLGLCDACKLPLKNNNSTMLTDAHVYFVRKTKEAPLSILEKKDKKKIKAYYLNMLEIEVDSRYLPTTYHTVHISKLGLCDACKLPLKNNNNEQIDISSLLVVAINNIENCQNDTLIQEDLNDERNDIEEEQKQTVEIKMQNILNKLEIKFN